MNTTAIVLFAHTPNMEARQKSFCSFSSQKATRKISSVLTHHFYTLAKQTTAETFLIDTFQQKGKSFGEKIAQAFADVYAKGFENVICIGNDCPDLDHTLLQHAITEVESGNVALGPTYDDGAYLIGIPKCQFNPQNFQQVSWQSKRTFKDLKALFTHDVVELPLLADVDEANDFSFTSAFNPLVKCLVNIIKSFRTLHQINIPLQKPVYPLVDRSFLKGPPPLSI